jgi:hypothetical protein
MCPVLGSHANGIRRHASEAVLTPVLKYEADRSGKALAGGVRCPALPVRSGNLGRIRDKPLAILFDDCRELVAHTAILTAYLRSAGSTAVSARPRPPSRPRHHTQLPHGARGFLLQPGRRCLRDVLAGSQSGEVNHVACEVDDLHRLTHVQDEDFAPLP